MQSGGATPNAGAPIWRPVVGGGLLGGAEMAADDKPARTNWQRQDDGVQFGGGDKWRRPFDGAKMPACLKGGPTDIPNKTEINTK